ncbi:ferredoxin [Mycobacterium eburneum]|nr:ferredoxin [Mycobacterium eburneum]TDH48348.1 ferredoxin [Mycobacterium eburneum]
MRIHLERDKCSGHARCYAVNPDLFPIDDSGYSTVTDHDVAPDDQASVREGVAACPETALRLEESDPQ